MELSMLDFLLLGLGLGVIGLLGLYVRLCERV